MNGTPILLIFILSIVSIVNCGNKDMDTVEVTQQRQLVQQAPGVLVYTKKQPPPPPFTVFNVQLPVPMIAPQTIAQQQEPQLIKLLPSPPSIYTINAPRPPPPNVRIISAPGAPLAAIMARNSGSSSGELPLKSS